MNRDTPLPEVAHVLPSKTANVLAHMPMETQESVLRFVRHALTNWEESDVCLDPITLETVLHDFVVALAALHSQNLSLKLILESMEV